MKKLLLIATLLFSACTKEYIIQVAKDQGMKEAVMFTDTTVNTVWDGGGKVLRITDHVIHGSGTLTNWIIDGAMTQQIFDTTIKLTNCRTYNDKFSCAWYGAKSSNADNWWNIQKSINTCLSNSIRNCYLPDGNFNSSKPLEILSYNATGFQQSSLHFYGDASFWDMGGGSTINYMDSTGCALNLQLNKGSEVDHLIFKGLFKSPTAATDSLYYTIPYEQYNDASSHHCPDNYYGVVIDWRKPVDGRSISGSTGIHLHDITIGNFTHLLVMSPNGITRNDDILQVENLHLGDGKTGVVNSQAQEKGMSIQNVDAWGNLHTVVMIGGYGNYQAGDYNFERANIAGHVIRPFFISAGNWFSTHINNWFCESIREIGFFQVGVSGPVPITISNSTFDLVPTQYIGQRIVISSNNPLVVFNSDIIRYYSGTPDELWFHGVATFNSCSFYMDKVIWK